MATALAPLPETAPELLPTLRFITCGSVDDGKSTLLGRLLHDAGTLASDQLETLAADSARRSRDAEPDYSLLLDGLEAEREQGITIDVAYRYFASARRAFIVADTPGHEQYTRNMVTGASTADLAVILVDARRGVQPQTRRHSRIVRLLGIRHVVLAVNKMDLAGFDHAAFYAIVAEYRALATQVGIARFSAVPVVARDGDNIVARSPRMAWYRGPTILEALEAAEVAQVPDAGFAMPVQNVLRPDSSFRGYAGQVAAGRVAAGARVRVLPAGTTATIARVVAPEGDRAGAGAGESTLLTFAQEVDCSRGDVLAGEGASVGVADEIGATLVWMSREPLALGRRMLLKLGTRTVPARVTAVEGVFDPDTGDSAPRARWSSTTSRARRWPSISRSRSTCTSGRARWAASSWSTRTATPPPPPGWWSGSRCADAARAPPRSAGSKRPPASSPSAGRRWSSGCARRGSRRCCSTRRGSRS